MHPGGIADIAAFASVTLSIFLVMNPFSSIPTFLSITSGVGRDTLKSYANRAVVVAGALLFMFIFIGSPLMSLFGVTMESFRVAGGVILVLMGAELVFGLKMSKMSEEKDAPWIIVATPIMTGPGVITAAILFTQEYGYAEVILAGMVALIATWALLRLSPSIVRLVAGRCERPEHNVQDCRAAARRPGSGVHVPGCERVGGDVLGDRIRADALMRQAIATDQ